MNQTAPEENSYLPEIIVAVVGRMGSQLTPTINAIKGEAIKYGYRTEPIRVTELLDFVDHSFELAKAPLEERYRTHISACNDLRKLTGRKDIFSLLSANYIRSLRIEGHGGSSGTVYILNQLKKPEEIVTLRSIYGQALIVVSCHASYNSRLRHLTEKLLTQHGDPQNKDKWGDIAKDLIDTDEKEIDPFGQNVRAAFPLADVIVDTDIEEIGLKDISRLFRLLFGDHNLSPKYTEYGNNLAAQAALRSTDLSRQVGAAIFDENKVIISLGSNEVPKSGGGTYWAEDAHDGRDVAKGYDVNTLRKRDLVIDIVHRLQQNDILKKGWEKKTPEELCFELLDQPGSVLSESLVLNILEYGRAMHAEMNAITDAARTQRATNGATLFVTTFPCHNCAKHIVGAGIQQVYYLEPYPKSEVTELYPDSITVDPSLEEQTTKVRFNQFCGITDQIFSMFSKNKSKDKKGIMHDWSPENALCILRNLPADFIAYEDMHVADLKNILETLPANAAEG